MKKVKYEQFENPLIEGLKLKIHNECVITIYCMHALLHDAQLHIW